MLPCRDNNGAIRILNPGNLPFTKDILDFHAAKIEERARYEKRKASFQMVIDANLCAGCKQCGQVCKFGAIRRVR